MNTASGTSPDEARWPSLVIAAPRGLREITWHLGLVAVSIGALAVKGGWLVLPWVAIICWILGPTPRQLGKVSATYLGVALALVWRLSPRSLSDHFIASLQGTASLQPSALDLVVHFLFLLAVSTAAIAVMLGYDRRSVNRRIVDQRVWERQVRRRRQLMRRWAWGRQLPEVLR